MNDRRTPALPDTLPELAEGAVHVWRATIDGRDHARDLVRNLLAAYLDRRPAEIALTHGPHGKPRLADAGGGDLRFNLSHSGSLALFAVARQREVGIDVERLRERPRLDRLAERWLSKREAATLRSLPPAERRRTFYACWTRKEAFLKARGDGLALPLRDFDVTVEADSPPRLLRTAWDPDETRRWSLHDIPVPDGYLAALAVREPDPPGNGDQPTAIGARTTVALYDLPPGPLD